MSLAEFAGVTEDKDRGVTSKGGLYEFRMEDTGHIYLHDTHLRRLTYQPGRPPMLELEFVYDPPWTPPELSKTPVVVFRFKDVRLVELRQEQEGHDSMTAKPRFSACAGRPL
ncbi:hypothetical protein ACWEJ6_44400 [Nonomuraea sp. NPDC004702]